jgi:hypothetical protein
MFATVNFDHVRNRARRGDVIGLRVLRERLSFESRCGDGSQWMTHFTIAVLDGARKGRACDIAPIMETVLCDNDQLSRPVSTTPLPPVLKELQDVARPVVRMNKTAPFQSMQSRIVPIPSSKSMCATIRRHPESLIAEAGQSLYTMVCQHENEYIATVVNFAVLAYRTGDQNAANASIKFACSELYARDSDLVHWENLVIGVLTSKVVFPWSMGAIVRLCQMMRENTRADDTEADLHGSMPKEPIIARINWARIVLLMVGSSVSPSVSTKVDDEASRAIIKYIARDEPCISVLVARAIKSEPYYEGALDYAIESRQDRAIMREIVGL